MEPLAPITANDARGLLTCTDTGPALIVLSHTDADGHTVQTAQAVNVAMPTDDAYGEGGYDSLPIVQPDVYPNTLSLTEGGTRQLDVHVTDPDTGDVLTLSPLPTGPVSAVRYLSGDASIATVSDSGLITAHKDGVVTISVVFLYSELADDGSVVTQTLA